jgi:hypothetical protein
MSQLAVVNNKRRLQSASPLNSSIGSKTLYAWAKDATGNVSSSLNASVTISSPVPSYRILNLNGKLQKHNGKIQMK